MGEGMIIGIIQAEAKDRPPQETEFWLPKKMRIRADRWSDKQAQKIHSMLTEAGFPGNMKITPERIGRSPSGRWKLVDSVKIESERLPWVELGACWNGKEWVKT